MSTSSPGSVFVREQNDSSEVELALLKQPWDPDANALPSIVPPHGLSIERQWYLYEKIWLFCPEDDQDSVCPLPSAPKPGGSRRGTPHPDPEVGLHLILLHCTQKKHHQHHHLNVDGSVVCVMRLGMTKETALKSRILYFYLSTCNPIILLCHLPVCISHAAAPFNTNWLL